MRVPLPTLVCPLAMLASLVSFSLTSANLLAETSAKKAPGLGDPGKLTSVVLDTGRIKDGGFTIAGRDAGQQIVVTGQYDSGQVRDLSRTVTYQTAPAGIVEVDANGHVTPIKEGTATVSVKSPEGLTASAKVTVTNIDKDLPINFPNQVVPIFTKFGCNGGGCHGKSGGQNGFRLSLLGFEPTEDFEYLVKEGRGRRLFPAAPERSLLLMKANATLPHGGGHRIETNSPPYLLMKRWIEQGMPYGNDTDPQVTRIEVFPQERLLGRDATQQIVVVAHYSDGSSEDVTRTTQFDSNDAEMAEVSVTGLVKTGQLTGSVAVMARYQGNVGVFRATIPLGLKVENLPPTKNYIDDLVFSKLKALGLPASGVCDDATFLRRVSIDLAGRLPTLSEVEQFLADKDPNKRAKAHRSIVGERRLCGLLCQQMERDSSQQAPHRSRQDGDVCLPHLDSSKLARKQALRCFCPRSAHRFGGSRQERAGCLV